MKQGKCVKCKVRFEWEREIHSRKCYCPDCGSKLAATNHMLKWRTIRREPIDAIAAYRLRRRNERRREGR